MNAIWSSKLGLCLILLSGVFWFSLLAVPFLPFTVASRVMIAGGLFAGVQIAWWSGAALAGPAIITRLKSWWRRNKAAKDDKSTTPK